MASKLTQPENPYVQYLPDGKINPSGLKFYLSKIYHNVYLELSNIQGRDPIVVFQMGKVGSKSIAESLKAAMPGTPVYHAHFITEDGLDYFRKLVLAPHRLKLGRPYWTGHYLRRQIEKNTRIWKIISLVRDPIARNISAFFHNVNLWVPGFNNAQSSLSVDELKDVFLERFPSEMPLKWFDTEMKTVFGIDVYQTPFPVAQGYDIYSGVHAKLLLIRLEDLTGVIDRALKDFLGLEEINLIPANIASERYYADIYRDFLRQVVLPEAYIQKMYESKLAQHFYTAEEIARFKAKWSRKR